MFKASTESIVKKLKENTKKEKEKGANVKKELESKLTDVLKQMEKQ
jgi:hypothetical protein